jgi:RNA polymerase sigma-70 factor (ECF subfamily)
MVDSPQDDETLLIARSQRGEVQAFNQLVLRYQQLVYNFVLRMLGNSEVAADITQDTFFAAFRAIQSFHPGSSFRAWLLRIASNQACDHWRRVNRHAQESLDRLADEDESRGNELLNTLIATGDEINPEASLLSREQRVAVVLCDIQGLSYEEIAATTRSTLGTVRSRIARGRSRLRAYLLQHQELLPRNYRLLNDRD